MLAWKVLSLRSEHDGLPAVSTIRSLIFENYSLNSFKYFVTEAHTTLELVQPMSQTALLVRRATSARSLVRQN